MEKPGNFRSVRLWNECRTFVRAADGRPGAGVGAHDDCVIAMAIAQAVRAEMAGWKGQRETAVGRKLNMIGVAGVTGGIRVDGVECVRGMELFRWRSFATRQLASHPLRSG